jgi:phage terminase Nu1 subunit (DNA packaging protein)
MESLTVLLTDQQIDAIAERIIAKLPAKTDAILYNEKKAAELLGVSPNSLKNWRCRGWIECSKRGRPPLYTRDRLQEIAEWLVKRGGEEASE